MDIEECFDFDDGHEGQDDCAWPEPPSDPGWTGMLDDVNQGLGDHSLPVCSPSQRRSLIVKCASHDADEDGEPSAPFRSPSCVTPAAKASSGEPSAPLTANAVVGGSSPACSSSSPASTTSRKRLRCKTSPLVLQADLPEDPQLPTSTNMWEGLESLTLESQRYSCVYNKFRAWASRRFEQLTAEEQNTEFGSGLGKARTGLRRVSLPIKEELRAHFLEETAASEDAKQISLQWWKNEARTEEKTKPWLHSKSVMLTWNGDWGKYDMGGKDIFSSVSVAVETLQESDSIQQLWAQFTAWWGERVSEFYPNSWAIAMELCLDTLAQGEVRVHLHAFMKRENPFHFRTPEKFKFKDSTPNQQEGVACIMQRATAGWAGMYYLLCPKIGGIFKSGSKKPFKEFPVNPQWIFGMIQAEKMDLADARREIVACGSGVVRRLADVDKLIAIQKRARLEERVAQAQLEIQKQNAAFHTYEQICSWLAQAQRPFQRRKRFLVLDGPSQLGKTEFVRGLFPLGSVLELNCASCGTSPNLRDFDEDVHKCILFDEGTVAMVLKNRKLFQCPAVLVDLGHSPTGRDVYTVYLNDAVIVVGSNNWSQEVGELKKGGDAAWLSANAEHVAVTSPMYMKSAPSSTGPTMSCGSCP